jgi:hypothetical protein
MMVEAFAQIDKEAIDSICGMTMKAARSCPKAIRGITTP